MHHAVLLSLLTAGTAVTALPSCSQGPPRNQHAATAIQCPIVFDGRVGAATELADFDSYGTSIFNPDYVKGQNLKWSQIIKFPEVANSRFDNETHKPFEVTISDASIFQSQRGFRRAGLQFQGDSNNGSPGSSGVKTIHFSVRWDAQRALNLSHEYLNVWHEAADYSANQFNFQAGAIIGQSGLPRDTYKVLNRQNRQIWSTPIVRDDWQNFAIKVDFNRKYVALVMPSSRRSANSQQHPPSVLLRGRRAAQERHQRRLQQQCGRGPVPDWPAKEADRHQRRSQFGLPGEQSQRGPHLRELVC